MKPALADSAVVDVAVVAVEYVRRTHGFDELLRRLPGNLHLSLENMIFNSR